MVLRERELKYPVYIPSKGRPELTGMTATILQASGIPFKLVIEPHEYTAYAKTHGEEKLLKLPFRDQGSVIPARNWIKDHAVEHNHKRHWQLDDDINRFYRWTGKNLYRCNAAEALICVEEFADRYQNVALAGLNHTAFGQLADKPFQLNTQVFSCFLFLNELPHRWRGRYNDDTDMALQVLSSGWCTVRINAYLFGSAPTLSMKGGNTSNVYNEDPGAWMVRARALQRQWPHAVTITKAWGRAQQRVRWSNYTTPLLRVEKEEEDGK